MMSKALVLPHPYQWTPLLLSCFLEKLIMAPLPMVISAPVYPLQSLCIAYDASTYHFIFPMLFTVRCSSKSLWLHSGIWSLFLTYPNHLHLVLLLLLLEIQLSFTYLFLSIYINKQLCNHVMKLCCLFFWQFLLPSHLWPQKNNLQSCCSLWSYFFWEVLDNIFNSLVSLIPLLAQVYCNLGPFHNICVLFLSCP